jgi:uncharacterized protein YuzE
MKIEYDPEVDALYIRLRPAPEGGVENRPVTDEVIADYGPDGRLVGLEILEASTLLGAEDGRVTVELAAPTITSGR